MGQDVADLVVLGVRGLLEEQVLRELVAAVAHVHAGEEDLASPIGRPVHAGIHELAWHRRRAHAGIALHAAPAGRHVPGVFQHHGIAALLSPAALEHVLVQRSEALLQEQGDVAVGGQLGGAVVHAFHAARAGEGVHDHVLRAPAVGHAQADRQHELLALEAHLDGTQELEALLLHALQVHLHHEELEPAADVGVQHVMGRLGDLVPVVQQPVLQTGALLGAQDQHVVLAHLIARLDGHAVVHFAAHGRDLGVRHFRLGDLIHHHHVAVQPLLAGVLVVVLHQSR